MTLATAEFDCYGKTTRRAAFLAEMEHVVPWSAPCGLIDYPKPGNGRPPVGVERMLRIYFFAAMVQPVGPGSGRGALRFAGDARFCQDRSRPRAGPWCPSARDCSIGWSIRLRPLFALLDRATNGVNVGRR